MAQALLAALKAEGIEATEALGALREDELPWKKGDEITTHSIRRWRFAVRDTHSFFSAVAFSIRGGLARVSRARPSLILLRGDVFG